MTVINENNLYETIESFCKTNCESKFCQGFDGNKMHYLSFVQDRAKASVLLLHGFTESAEKMTEVAYYFYNEEYNIYALSLRGHGNSFKPSALRYAVDIDDFSEYGKDVDAFVRDVIPDSLPLFVFGHSLGCTAALLAAAECGTKFDKIVLSSPMICGNMGMPVPIANLVSSVICAVRKGNTPAPGKCVFNPDEQNIDATSVIRGNNYIKYKATHESHQTCGPTMKWVKASVKAAKKLTDEKYIRNISCSVLLLKPENDRQLLESYQDKFIAICNSLGKEIKVKTIYGANHEIFQSTNDVLAVYLKDIFEFLA